MDFLKSLETDIPKGVFLIEEENNAEKDMLCLYDCAIVIINHCA